jgi:hypothetical protein
MYAKRSIHGQPTNDCINFSLCHESKNLGSHFWESFRFALSSDRPNETQSSLSIASLQNWDTWLPVAEDQVFKAAIHTHLFWLLSLVAFCLYSGWISSPATADWTSVRRSCPVLSAYRRHVGLGANESQDVVSKTHIARNPLQIIVLPNAQHSLHQKTMSRECHFQMSSTKDLGWRRALVYLFGRGTGRQSK